MSKWNTRLIVNGEQTATINMNRGISQGRLTIINAIGYYPNTNHFQQHGPRVLPFKERP